MTPEHELKALKAETFEILRNSRGCPNELYDMELNDISCQAIIAYANIYEGQTCYLGKVNRYSEDKGKPYLVPYSGQQVFNFEYNFMIPVYDARLINLIADRDETEYTGTREDFVLVTEIMDRIEGLKGIHLFWV